MMDEQSLVRGLLSEQTKVMGYIKSFVRRQETAKDIFQEICVLALQKRPEINDEAHLKKWMRTSARFYALRTLRKRAESHLSLDHDVADVMDRRWNSMDSLDQSQMAEALRGCMGALSSANRRMLEKRFVANCDYDRLAKDLNRSVSSLYTAFSRIYSSLARCISDKLSLQPR